MFQYKNVYAYNLTSGNNRITWNIHQIWYVTPKSLHHFCTNVFVYYYERTALKDQVATSFALENLLRRSVVASSGDIKN